MATLAQLEKAFIQADDAGNTEDAKAFADAIREMRSASKTPEKQTIYNEETVYDPVTGVPISSGGGGESAKGATGKIAKGLETLVSVPAAFSAGASNVASSLGSMLPGSAGQYFKEMGQQSQGMVKGMGQATDSGYVLPAAQMAGEITAVSPAGRLIGGGLQKVAPKVPQSLIQAIQTSGGSGGNLATRAAGGAIAGGASAGVLNPDDALLGASIGATLPFVGAAASKLFGSANQSDDMVKAINAARESGYVIPPTQANPTLTNRLLEGYAGKLTTAQNASAKNQEVTNKLAAKALGLSDDVQITPEVLDGVRAEAGKAYEALAALPIKEGSKASTLMNTPGAAKIDPRQMVYDLRVARNNSTAYYNSYGRTADPEALTKAQAFKKEAAQLESALENYAKSIGRSDLVPELRNARQLIAKTYTVEKALNPTTGSVNAQKLAGQLEKGKPLSGELKDIAEFSQRFKTATKTPEQMGSLPQFSPIDVATGIGSVGVSQYTDNPLYLALAGGRPVARSLALSPVVQNRLAQKPKDINQLLELLRTASPSMASQMFGN